MRSLIGKVAIVTGGASDIGDLALYLANEPSSFITGTSIKINN